MGQFTKHAACQRCGSRDNVAVYDDGREYCFSCDKFIKGDAKADEVKSFKSYTLPDLFDVDLSARRITPDTCHKYKVGEDRESVKVYFPYITQDGDTHGAKTRSQDDWEKKNYLYEGNTLPFFGLHTITAKHKKILIVEGELDALAAYQMYGQTYGVLSVANGAKGSNSNFKESVKFLNSFDEVVIMFDDDAVGKEGRELAKQYIKPGKLRIVYDFGVKGHNDACDFLKANHEGLFRDVIQGAVVIKPKGIVDKQDLYERTLAIMTGTDKRYAYKPTGFKGFDEAVGGFNPGELITIAASTGVGKTTLSLQLVINALNQGLKVMVFSLETADTDVVRKLIEMKFNVQVISSKNNTPFIEGDVSDKIKTFTDNITFHENLGAVDLKELENEIEYAAMAGLADIIILDHITAAAQIEKGNGQVQHIDAMMNLLNRLTIKYGLWTLVISHVSRDSDDKARKNITLNHIRFSEGIAQYSHCVIGITRPMQDNVIKCTMLKGHRKYGRFPDFELYYDENTHNYKDVDYANGIQAFDGTSQTLSKFKQVQCEGGVEQGRNNEVPFTVRETSTRVEPEVDTRTEDTTLPVEVQARLCTDNEVGEDDIYRSERILSVDTTNEVSCSEESQPRSRLASLVLITEQPRKLPLKDFFKSR